MLRYLLAQPCNEAGSFFTASVPEPVPATPPDATHDNPWAPFEDRLAFDWARYHYVKLQSSAAEIGSGLDLWLASIIKNKSDGTIPWNSAQDMYSTIDAIKAGSSTWKTFRFRYASPEPDGPVPKWMEVEYELNTRDILTIVEQQLATTQFEGQFNYSPYREFGPDGQRIWSNFMSALWAWKQAVSDSISFMNVFLNLFRIRSRKMLVLLHIRLCWYQF